jgi:adenosylcobinamide-GDP ribazoletransferase
MRRFLAAVAFLTRIPVPARLAFGAKDVGRAALLFPLVGAMLGALSVGLRYIFFPTLPAHLTGVLVVAAGALATGALHLDGLADMSDGFGGGRTREDVLRIMRDHAIGAYGAVALILVLFAKIAAIGALVETGRADAYLVVAPALARWATVPMARLLPYARREGGTGAAVTEHVGWTEVVGATVIAGLVTWELAGWRGAACAGAVVAVCALNALLCLRRIGGVTGDTLGANAEVSETVVLLLAVGLV